jgi:hypothetical protein
MPMIADVMRALMGQERAMSNARTAATDLSRRRVERQDVELYLADRETASDAGAAVRQQADDAREARRR